jgi:hypothetical protein
MGEEHQIVPLTRPSFEEAVETARKLELSVGSIMIGQDRTVRGVRAVWRRAALSSEWTRRKMARERGTESGFIAGIVRRARICLIRAGWGWKAVAFLDCGRCGAGASRL